MRWIVALLLLSGCQHYWVSTKELARVEKLPAVERRKAAVAAEREKDGQPVYLKGKLLALAPASKDDRPGFRRARAIPAIQPAGVVLLTLGAGLVAGGATLLSFGVPSGDGAQLGWGAAMAALGGLHVLIGAPMTGFAWGTRPQETSVDRPETPRPADSLAPQP